MTNCQTKEAGEVGGGATRTMLTFAAVLAIFLAFVGVAWTGIGLTFTGWLTPAASTWLAAAIATGTYFALHGMAVFCGVLVCAMMVVLRRLVKSGEAQAYLAIWPRTRRQAPGAGSQTDATATLPDDGLDLASASA